MAPSAKYPEPVITQWARRETLRVAVIYLGLRLIALISLFIAAPIRGTYVGAIYHRWDAQWYRRIAQFGYGNTLTAADGRHLHDYAFFPAFPFMERFIHFVTGINYIYAGAFISLIASIAAAIGIYKVVGLYQPKSVGLFNVALWALLPVASVQWLSYSEALFTATAAWAIYFSCKKQYLVASLFALIAGATRPVGIAVVLAVSIPALINFAKKQSVQDLLGALISPLGLIAYLFWVGYKLNDPLGYFTVTRGWGNGFDGGKSFASWIVKKFGDGELIQGFALVAAVVALFALLYWAIKAKAPIPVAIFVTAMVLLSISTSGYFGSKPRYLLPAFPLLVPIAVKLSTMKRNRALLVMIVAGSASIIYGAFWLTGSGPL
jgi:Gpi18-like mannosyltransferase